MLTVDELHGALAHAVRAQVGKLVENAALAMPTERKESAARFERGLRNLISAHTMATEAIERVVAENYEAAFPPCPSCGVPAGTIHAPGCAQALAFDHEMQGEMLARLGKDGDAN